MDGVDLPFLQNPSRGVTEVDLKNDKSSLTIFRKSKSKTEKLN
jgi:hypothetical protein